MRLMKLSKFGSNFYLFRLLAAFFPFSLVFVSKTFLDFADFAEFQSDYALILFGASLSSLGLGVVAQIIGSKYPSLQYELFLMSIVTFIIVMFLNFVFNELVIKILPFTRDDFFVRYFWPSYLFLTILPSYYLGAKKYSSFFLPSIFFSIFLLIGICLKLLGVTISIFFLSFCYNFIYLIKEYFLVLEKKVMENVNFISIFRLLKIETFAFYSGTLGIKNYSYYIITFFGVSVFGELKLFISFFNILNFILSSKIIIFSNEILKSNIKRLSNFRYNKFFFL